MTTVNPYTSTFALLTLLALTACKAEPPTPVPSQDAQTDTWIQAGYVKAAIPIEGEQIGYSVALSGDGNTFAAGAPMNASSGSGVNIDNPAPDDYASYGSGAVYVYGPTDNGWSQQGFIKASNTGLNDQFGSSVALSGDGNTLAVAAAFEDSASRGINGDGNDNSLDQSGAVYVFSRSGTLWSQQAYLKASNTGDPADGDTFGYSISLGDDGRTLAVGAPSEDGASGINGDESDNSASGAGAVYIFSLDSDEWSQEAYIKSSNPGTNVLFGYSVALSADGNTLATGAYDDNDRQGGVYVFDRSGGAWSERAFLGASNAEAGDSMGAWVAISDDGNTIAAGSADEDSLLTGVNRGDQGGNDQVTNTSAGAAYIFTRSENEWSQQAYIKASNPGHEDWFGMRLALSGDGQTFAASSPNEDSASQGIAGVQDDDTAQEAGAVYLYRRNGNVWTHQVYVKGSNTDQFDEFGGSVALDRDGTMMVVGARFEDGSTTELNSDRADNSAPDSGAVYLFTR
jgi:hypothetical protein